MALCWIACDRKMNRVVVDIGPAWKIFHLYHETVILIHHTNLANLLCRILKLLGLGVNSGVVLNMLGHVELMLMVAREHTFCSNTCNLYIHVYLNALPVTSFCTLHCYSSSFFSQSLFVCLSNLIAIFSRSWVHCGLKFISHLSTRCTLWNKR